MKQKRYALLLIALLFSAPVLSTNHLYDGFKNPPNTARPFVRWDWSAKSPTEKEIIRQLDILTQAGLGGVEIYPAEDANAKCSNSPPTPLNNAE